MITIELCVNILIPVTLILNLLSLIFKNNIFSIYWKMLIMLQLIYVIQYTLYIIIHVVINN